MGRQSHVSDEHLELLEGEWRGLALQQRVTRLVESQGSELDRGDDRLGVMRNTGMILSRLKILLISAKERRSREAGPSLLNSFNRLSEFAWISALHSLERKVRSGGLVSIWKLYSK